MNTEEYFLSKDSLNELQFGQTIEIITKEGNLVKLIPISDEVSDRMLLAEAKNDN